MGSTAYITDEAGDLQEHLEYFPFGETWVAEGGSKKTPYLYTSKEYDSETGLYYYGARYYDARTSVWVSVDPILEKYLPVVDEQGKQRAGTSGGVFDSLNLNMYAYSGLNPVKYIDPDGNRRTNPENKKVNEVTDQMVDYLDMKVQAVSGKEATFQTNSGVRTLKDQEGCNTCSKTSKHLEENGGTAIDVNVFDMPEGMDIYDIAAMAQEEGFTGIIVYTPENGTSKAGPRLHLDRRSNNGFAPYIREAVKGEDGKTQYQPRDYIKMQEQKNSSNGGSGNNYNPAEFEGSSW